MRYSSKGRYSRKCYALQPLEEKLPRRAGGSFRRASPLEKSKSTSAASSTTLLYPVCLNLTGELCFLRPDILAIHNHNSRLFILEGPLFRFVHDSAHPPARKNALVGREGGWTAGDLAAFR